MRARNWTVGILAEFYPDQKNLLVVDTMLHELAHNVHGPHNEQFHALWDQERKEYEALLSKGYSGEGFLSNGRQLGGRRIPMHEARRLARAAAEKRATLSSGSGQKLGGRPLRVGTDIRKVIVDAIERRGTVLKGCGSAEKNDDEIEYLATRAVQNGFKTKAEEDEANDRAIAAAVWELIQEDQKNEYGDNYVPSTPANPTGNGGGTVGVSKRIKTEPSSSKPASPSQSLPIPPRQAPKHISRLVGESSSKRSKPEMPKAVQPPDSSSASEMTGWTHPEFDMDMFEMYHHHGRQMVDLQYLWQDEGKLLRGKEESDDDINDNEY
ncbi:putative DNA damage response protein WSS1 [Glarea lozoyensis 74030]|uniref:Putative DNA damage response protein WSS1 n=1 Tax=Glarea lozoyensis (strain ATCC 74030 / MF5533) TaxID=1104152 RepID=H0EH10_GLAL7|nr:putative DNA damage response protein WSS1 [Glarea lozoyensis 74030]